MTENDENQNRISTLWQDYIARDVATPSMPKATARHAHRSHLQGLADSVRWELGARRHELAPLISAAGHSLNREMSCTLAAKPSPPPGDVKARAAGAPHVSML